MQGVTVYTPSKVLNQSHVIMMFQSGAGVEVIENKGYMATRVYLPWTFIVSILHFKKEKKRRLKWFVEISLQQSSYTVLLITRVHIHKVII